ncbi:phage recombination protein Bet [Candidatus Pacearchaeota archaeon]|jgi:phage recombination protein Bet|nr:phage recombination protein Bet [Candidatus Pacearchaeota archaeon]
MAGKVSKTEIASAIDAYCTKHGAEKSYDESTDSFHIKDANGLECIFGPGLKCSTQGVFDEIKELIFSMRMDQGTPSEPITPRQTIAPTTPRKPNGGPLVKPDMPIRDIQVAELTFDDIKTYICPAANDQEVMIFLKLCQARNLNPFLRDAYLIKYDQTKAAQMVVGKDSFTKKAEDHPKFAGYKAGIIVKIGDVLERREGTFWMEGEVLVGGWAEVYRVDREKTPYKMEVSRKEYDTGKSNWVTKPATMIRKVALVQALREAFPSEFSGMYDQAEMGIDPEKEVKA